MPRLPVGLVQDAAENITDDRSLSRRLSKILNEQVIVSGLDQRPRRTVGGMEACLDHIKSILLEVEGQNKWTEVRLILNVGKPTFAHEAASCPNAD